MLEVKNVTKIFKTHSGHITPVNKVSFTIEQGKFVSIIGKSGSGKSTLLSILGALDKPTSGEIFVDKVDIGKMREKEQVKYRSQKIGFIFQNYNLIPNLTAIENVMLSLEFAGAIKKERKDKAKKLLNEVGIDNEKQNRRPGKLSGGEQQRVAIARALANKPKLILADEPTGNLDTKTGKMIFDLLHKLSKIEKTTIIAVTHDLSIAGKTDMTYKLQDGILVK